MYFTPDSIRALQAARELLNLFTSGSIPEKPIETLDCALFLAGTINAHFAKEEVTTSHKSDLSTADLITILDRTIPETVHEHSSITTTVDWRLVLELAKRIICSI